MHRRISRVRRVEPMGTTHSFQESAVACLHTSSDLKRFEVVAMVKRLA